MQIRGVPAAARVVAAAAIVPIAIVAGCGGSGGSSSSPSAEAQSAATGDIPDNQVFLTFHNRTAGYSIQYPEGWTQRGNGSDVTFADKDNTIHVTVANGPAPTVSSVTSELAKLESTDPSVQPGTPQQLTINGAPVVKVSYTKQGPADPVTGKRLTLMVDRYEYAKGGKVATLDLGTPQGVDNVDAFRMISESFQWQ